MAPNESSLRLSYYYYYFYYYLCSFLNADSEASCYPPFQIQDLLSHSFCSINFPLGLGIKSHSLPKNDLTRLTLSASPALFLVPVQHICLSTGCSLWGTFTLTPLGPVSWLTTGLSSFLSSHTTCPRKATPDLTTSGPTWKPRLVRRSLSQMCAPRGLQFSFHPGTGYPASWLPLCLSSVQSLSHVQLPVTPWTAVCQASLSITNSLSLLKRPSSQWCHPTILSSAFNLSQHQGLIQWVSSSHQVTKVLAKVSLPITPQSQYTPWETDYISVHTPPSQMYFLCPPACPLPWRLTSKDGFHRFPCPLASGWFGSIGRGPRKTGGWWVRSWCLFQTPSLGDRLRLATSLTEVPSHSSDPLLPLQTIWGEGSACFLLFSIEYRMTFHEIQLKWIIQYLKGNYLEK